MIKKSNQIMGNRKLCWCRKMLLRKFVTTTGMRTVSRLRTVICAIQEKCWIFNSMENCSRIPIDWFQWIWTRIISTGSCFTLFAVRELESKPSFEKGAREQKVKPISLFIRILTRSLKKLQQMIIQGFQYQAMCKDCIKTAHQWFHWHLKLANQKASHETTWW